MLHGGFVVQSKNYRIWIRIAVIGILLALMAFCVPSGSVVAEEYASLPMEDVGGPEPDSDCYTDTTYTDPSLSVEIFYDTNGETAYIYAHVRIIDPTQIRSASAANAGVAAHRVAHRATAILVKRGPMAVTGPLCTVVSSSFLEAQGPGWQSSNFTMLASATASVSRMS